VKSDDPNRKGINNMSQPLRTAILGCGGFAHRHARTLQQLENDFEMVAFCNRTVEKAATFSKEYTNGRAPIFADHQQMFDQVPLDVVVICVPPYAHSDEVEIAANLGIHVFIEKPIALTSKLGWRCLLVISVIHYMRPGGEGANFPEDSQEQVIHMVDHAA
jgi:predicted dinucleotide-utilizing enzyme